MNFVFISPQFPDNYRHWCEELKKLGVNVLGIGDTPYDQIAPELKDVLTEYYWLPNLEDYDQVFRAVAFLSFKHGKIDWVESNNEHWLSLDARLREDFNVTTGVHPEQLRNWQSKAAMKPFYRAAGIPVARQIPFDTLENAREFIKTVGWPAFTKPEIGVGAGGAWKLENDEDLVEAFKNKGSESYVLEEYISGEICSYDAIVNSKGEPIFENQEEFPPSMSDVHSLGLDISYLSKPEVDPKLLKLGRAAVKSFGITSRFVHMEFFRLTADKPGLGDAGDYVGLEINARPPGGYTPNMMNYAHETYVYGIWAGMVCKDTYPYETPILDNPQHYCVHASRRHKYTYVHTHDEVMARYANQVKEYLNIPDVLSDDLGNNAYIACFDTQDEVDEFVAFVHAK